MQLIGLLTLAFLLGLPLIPFSQSTPVKFKGIIVDPNAGPVAKAGVLVESRENRWNLKSDEDGEFEVELPAGEYQITIEPPADFKKLVVSDFRVTGKKSIVRRFQLQFRQAGDYHWIVPDPEPTSPQKP